MNSDRIAKVQLCTVDDSGLLIPHTYRGERMQDEELLLQAANVPTMYFDGFGGFRKINGVFRCIGFVIGGGAQLNLIVSMAGAEMSNTIARQVLDEKPVKGLQMWGGAALPH